MVVQYVLGVGASLKPLTTGGVLVTEVLFGWVIAHFMIAVASLAVVRWHLLAGLHTEV